MNETNNEEIFTAIDLVMGGIAHTQTHLWREHKGKVLHVYVQGAILYRIEDHIQRMCGINIKRAERLALDYLLSRHLAYELTS